LFKLMVQVGLFIHQQAR